MAIHAGKKEFYERIQKIEKGDAEKQAEKIAEERKRLMAHKFRAQDEGEKETDGR